MVCTARPLSQKTGILQRFRTLVVAALLSVSAPVLCAQDAVQNAMEEYANFAPYDAGIILPHQITNDLHADLMFIDTRSAQEFEKSSIKGAIHIEWREVFSRMNDIPRDRKTVLFCNTGALSAQAVFGLRVLGYDNVLVLQGGFDAWQAK